MTLFVTDHGDPSVGRFPQTWEVICPFERDQVEQDSMEFFKAAILAAYAEFTECATSAEYDFELDKYEVDNGRD